MTFFETFFAMGGYAEFVWPAYALTAVVMIGLLVVSMSALRSDRKHLENLQRHVRPQRGQISDQLASNQETPNGDSGTEDVAVGEPATGDDGKA
jgi:heme exporter protein D